MPDRSFNDRFYSSLNDMAPSIRQGIQREVPLGIKWGGQVFSMAAIIGSPSGMGAEAQALQNMHAQGAASIVGDTPGAYDALRNEMRQESNRLFGQQGAGSAFYPDGMKDGTAIEIKGPGDSPGDGQYEKYQEASPNKQILVIDNKACDPGEKITNSAGKCK